MNYTHNARNVTSRMSPEKTRNSALQAATAVLDNCTNIGYFSVRLAKFQQMKRLCSVTHSSLFYLFQSYLSPYCDAWNWRQTLSLIPWWLNRWNVWFWFCYQINNLRNLSRGLVVSPRAWKRSKLLMVCFARLRVMSKISLRCLGCWTSAG